MKKFAKSYFFGRLGSPLRFKRLRNSAMVIFVISLLLCELPLLIASILALTGFGGVISASQMSLPPYIESMVYIAGALSFLVLLGLLFYRYRYRN